MSTSDEDEVRIADFKKLMESMTPNQRFEYDIQHMADPEFKKLFLKSLDLNNPAEKMLYDIESATKTVRLQKRKPPTRNKTLKSFDPETVYRVLLNLQTPASFSALKNSKDRLNRRVTATSLRQYVDALLTRGYITLADVKMKEQDYPFNFVPRTDFTVFYVSTRGGRRYAKAYAKILEMLSELDPNAPHDML